MRQCSMCGGVIPETSAFCHGCGARYEGAESSAPGSLNQASAYSHLTTPQGSAPMNQLKTDRSIGRFILFSIITLGIYTLVFHFRISRDINDIASRYDGKKTMNFVALFFLVMVPAFLYGIIIEVMYILNGGADTFWTTYLVSAALSIPMYVWYIRISDRIGNELDRRGLGNSFNSSTYWQFYGVPSIIAFLVVIAVAFSGMTTWISTWVTLASLIPICIYFHKLCVAFNQLAEDYNVHG